MIKLFKVFKFEFLNLVRRRSFILMVILVPLIPALVLTLLGILNDDQTQSLTQIFSSEVANPLPMGIVDRSGTITEYPDWLTYGSLVEVKDVQTARQQTAANQLEGFFVIAPDYLETGKVTYIKPEINMITEIVQQDTLDQLIDYNLMGSDQALYLRYTNPVSYNYVYLNPETADTRDQDSAANYFVPYAITMIFYILILISSSFMLNSVGKDKDNKTIEVLLTSSSPIDLFLGKLLGYGAGSLIQMLAWGGAVLILMKIGGQSFPAMQGLSLPKQATFLGVPYFIFGFLIYGSLMAGVGALAPNLREGNSSSFIISLPLIFTILVMNQLIAEPSSLFSVILSVFPFTSPVVMMTRLTIGTVPGWHIVLSLTLLIASVFLIVKGVSNLFSSQTLLSGEKFKLKIFFRTILFGR